MTEYILEMEEGPMSQGVEAAFQRWKSQGN